MKYFYFSHCKMKIYRWIFLCFYLRKNIWLYLWKWKMALKSINYFQKHAPKPGFPLWCVKNYDPGMISQNHFKNHVWTPELRMKTFENIFVEKKKPSGTLESQTSFENLIFVMVLGNHPRKIIICSHMGNPCCDYFIILFT